MKFENRQLMCLVQQTKIISAFYLGYVIFQVLYQVLGNLVFNTNTHFQCTEGDMIKPITNLAALYAFFHDFIMLFFSVMVVLVFYLLPFRFRLIARSKNGVINRFDSYFGDSIVVS